MKFLGFLESHVDAAWVVSSVSDKTFLCGSLDGRVSVWNYIPELGTFTKLKLINAHLKSKIYSLASLRDSRFVSGAHDGIIKIWDTENFYNYEQLNAHSLSVSSIAPSQAEKNHFLTQGMDETINIWNLKDKFDFLGDSECIQKIPNSTNYISMVISMRDRIICENNQSKIGIWSYETAVQIQELPGHYNESKSSFEHMRTFISLDTNSLISGSNMFDIKGWDLRQNSNTHTFLGHDNYINSLVGLDDYCFASASGDKLIKIWDTRKPDKPVDESQCRHTSWIQGLSFFNNCMMLSASGDNRIGIWACEANYSDLNDSDQDTKLHDINGHSVAVPIISMLDVKILKLLGEGTFGKVHEVEWQKKLYALKSIKNELDSFFEKSFKKEIKVLVSLKHLNIVAIYAIVKDKNHLGILMEFCEKSSLYDELHQEKEIDYDTFQKFRLGILRGVRYLHEQKIIHRDLKSQNVLITNDDCPKVCDFGLSEVKASITSTLDNTAGIGTIPWMAPELFLANPVYSFASDIYAIAIIFWEIQTRLIPFQGHSSEIILLLVQNGFRPELSQGLFSKSYSELLGKCWGKEIEERPKIDTIIDIVDSSKNFCKIPSI